MALRMTPEEIMVFLAENKVGRIATTDDKGQPHVAPIWHIIIDGDIYFETGAATRKARNLKVNRKMALVVDAGDNIHNYRGVVIQGEIEFVKDKKVIERFNEAFAQRYFGSTDHPDFKYLISLPGRTIMRIRRKRMTSWDYTKAEEWGGGGKP